MESLDYSNLTIKEIPVTLPDGSKWLLREADGKTATAHRNAIMEATQFGPDGKVVGIKNLASVEARFVAGCLWSDAEKPINIHIAMVEKLPARIQKQLYEKAQELSDMGEESAIRSALEKALDRSDSPVKFEEFTEWVESLPASEYRALHKLVASDRKELLKN